MPRYVADCRDYPSEKGCTLTITGEEDELLDAAVLHAVTVHGHQNTPELREQIRQSLKPEEPAEWTPAGRIEPPGNVSVH